MSTPVAGPLATVPLHVAAGDIAVWWDDAGGAWESVPLGSGPAGPPGVPGPAGPTGATGAAGAANITGAVAGQLTVAGSATSITSSIPQSTFLTPAAAASAYLPLTGGTLSGALNVNSTVTAVSSVGAVTLSGGGAGQTSLLLDLPSGGTDQKLWEILAQPGFYVIRALNDGYSAAADAIQIVRGSGYTISSVNFPSGAVGVGTTTPLFPFDVRLGTDAHFDLLSSTAGRTRVISFNDAGSAYSGLDIDGSTICLNTNGGGLVGIGTTTPTSELTVNGDVSAQNYLAGAQLTNSASTIGFTNGNGPSVIIHGTATSSAPGLFQLTTSGTVAVTIDTAQQTTFAGNVFIGSGANLTPYYDNSDYCGSPTRAWAQVNAHNYATISDPAQKTDIAPIPKGALAQVMEITPYSYHWKSEEAKEPLHWGFMAPEVKTVMGLDFAGAMRDEESGVLSLAYNDLTAVLWAAVQELAAEVAALKAQRQ